MGHGAGSAVTPRLHSTSNLNGLCRPMRLSQQKLGFLGGGAREGGNGVPLGAQPWLRGSHLFSGREEGEAYERLRKPQHLLRFVKKRAQQESPRSLGAASLPPGQTVPGQLSNGNTQSQQALSLFIADPRGAASLSPAPSRADESREGSDDTHPGAISSRRRRAEDHRISTRRQDGESKRLPPWGRGMLRREGEGRISSPRKPFLGHTGMVL
ncbi:hypothetical protein KIL84_010144 [Mauremys mutica]|uniref:Uncharacterized protein n=1 Tax=Mauremys mutica TaxID=74926 RepID=A0A9D3XNM3_9SAUR|nr:hypothetical protein KIL84_010144 [Mauremys mutica]